VKSVIDWLIVQVSTQWIAIITAVAGLIAWRSSRAGLIVDELYDAEPIAAVLLNNGSSLVNTLYSKQHLVVWIINPSDHDVSYYDLRVTLDAKEVNYLKAAQFVQSNGLTGTYPESAIPFDKNGNYGQPFIVTIPTTTYGTISAHGFVALDLIFDVAAPSDDGMVLMKLAEKHGLLSRVRASRFAPRWLRPKFGYTHPETKAVARSFHVTEVRRLDDLDAGSSDK
jgi:hypothetical protein